MLCVQSASPGGEVVGGLEPGHPAKGVEPLWQKKNEEVMEQNFQKDLEVHVHHIFIMRTCMYFCV